MPRSATDERARALKTAKKHQLLSDATRLELLWLLSKRPHTVSELSSALGVHVNTVRAHLERLMEAGLVYQEKGSPAGRGRPARRLLLSAEGLRQSDLPARDYQLLSEVLLSVLRSQAGKGIGKAAERSGRGWGRHLAGPSAKPGNDPAPEVAAGMVSDIFERLQFSPEIKRTRQGWDVLLHNCPYREIARDNQDAICSFHRGVLSGVLDIIGGDLQAEGLEPFVEPDICRASMRRRPRRPDPPDQAAL